eukprot:CAMPEP_0117447906 /NCGR_PEP_ID=MMETSP0759-20121206/7118_1 /TAXON_ID=63605 /ORGANISM="Percolomonas cosmopolitus, Strain WS" /LENGTH=1421 /DNA_ID=CAMNT_0005240259 /DNA_START=147 /DNA_END=4412 /DNA_ORIENTATION=+
MQRASTFLALLLLIFALSGNLHAQSPPPTPNPSVPPKRDDWYEDYQPNRIDGHAEVDKDLFVEYDKEGKQHIKFRNFIRPQLNIDYLGRGYDYYEGNPKETAAGGDAGYRLPIFSIDSLAERRGYDHRFLKPNRVDVSSRVSCSTHASSKAMGTSKELQQSISKSSQDISGFGVGVSFQGAGVDYSQNAKNSKGFEDLSKSLSTGEEVAVSSEATCTVYQASINPIVLPELHPEFKHSLESLGAYSGATEELYQYFIRTYGTHVVTQVLMGSRYGKIYLMKKSALSTTESRTDSRSSSIERSISAGYSNGDASAKASYGWGNGESEVVTVEKENMLSEMSEDEKVYSIGAPYVPDIEEWAQASLDTPAPVKIQLMPLDVLVSIAAGEEKGRDISRALANYRPQGYTKSTLGFRQCYIARSQHVTFDPKTKKQSLIAKCQNGYTVLGGTFEHIWNANGDVQVDALATTQKSIMSDLSKFHNLRMQEEAVKYLIEHGAEMIKKFADANVVDHIGEIFGERINPLNLQKFLMGKLQTLGIEKADSLKRLSNGLLLFGQGKLGGLTSKFLGKNPYTQAIFGTSQSLHENKTYVEPDVGDGNPDDAQALSVDPAIAEKHADVLAELFNTLDHKNGGKLFKTDEANAQFFDLIKKAMEHISGNVKKWWEKEVSPHLTEALSSWKDFSTRINDIWNDERLGGLRKKIISSDLFQNVLGRIKQNKAESQPTTMLATRNAVNWLFPHADNEFVCGSGNLGLDATARSSMGYCSALCCVAEGWEFETYKERRATIKMEEQTSAVTAVCDTGLTLVSGGILLGDYEDGRFVQIVENRPDENGAWKCKIKWSEEYHIPYPPRFRCYARCASSNVAKPVCQNAEQPLVNGHGTATCPPNTIAVAGGWSVQSNGVTYLKKTEFKDISEGQGAQSFRCELGTSHDSLVGTCVARCCDVQVLNAEQQLLQNSVACPHAWERMGRRDIGSTIDFEDDLHKTDSLVSQNGKFYLTYDPDRTKITVREVLDRCGDSHTIGEIDFENNCGSYPVGLAAFGFGSWGFQAGHAGVLRRFFPAPFVPSFYKRDQPTYPPNSRVSVTANGLTIYDGDKRCGDKEYSKEKVNTLELSDNGDLVFYDDDKNALFTHRFSLCRLMYRRLLMEKSTLESGELLLLNQGLVSKNKNNMLWFLPGGALAVIHQHSTGYCREPNLLWTTAKQGDREVAEYAQLYEFNNDLKEGWVLRLQADNNLVVYDDKSNAIWASGTDNRGIGKAILTITDGGQLELKDSVGVTLWNNRYGAVKSCESLRDRLKIRSHRLGAGSSIKPGVGGLVSKNGEYIVYIEKSETGNNLEWWRSGGSDCKPVRLCTIKKGVSDVQLKSEGIYFDGNNAFNFPGHVPLNEIVLHDNGELYAYGGHENRREVSAYISAHWDCTGMRHA